MNQNITFEYRNMDKWQEDVAILVQKSHTNVHNNYM